MKLALILAPYDSGHYRSGFGAGPEAILSAGLVAALEAAGHGVEVADIGRVGDAQGRELATGFAVCRAVAERVARARRAGRFPVTLAGNCLTTAGAVAGEAAEAIVWFDQHGDLNTPETSAHGFLDGMALAVTLGLCWQAVAATIPGFRPIDPARALLVDGRDLDPGEAELLRGLPLRQVGCGDVGTDFGPWPTHLHLDLDIHDPALLRVNRYATPGGPGPAQVRAAARQVARQARLCGLTVSAYDPAVDPEARVPEAASALILGIVEELERRA